MRNFLLGIIAVIMFFPLAGFSPAKGKNPFEGYTTKANDTHFKLIRKGKGTVLADSGYAVFMKLKFLTEKDSAFLDINETAKSESYAMLIDKPKFKGDFIDMFRSLHAGDSAKFFINLDTLHKYYPTDFTFDPKYNSMKYLGFAVRVDSIFNKEQVVDYRNQMNLKEQERNMTESAMKQLQSVASAIAPQLVKQDSILFVKFLYKTNPPEPDKNGCFYIERIAGKGAPVAYGKKITIRYTGSFLDGTIFDTNQLLVGQEAMVITLDQNTFIPGFTYCLLKMKAGGVARFILPYELAYKDGITRIFDVQVISVE